MPGAATVAELQVVVGADTSGAEGALGKLGSSLGTVIGGAVAGVGVAVAAGVAVGIQAAGDLEQAVANISTIKPEINTEAIFGSLNEMSTRIPQTAAQLGESLYNVFSSVDVSAEQGLQLVEKFAKGAVGAGTDAETFGTAAMGVMNAYKLSVEDADHISDVFFNTIKLGVVTGPELAASLGPVTQSAKAAGVGLDEMGAMIAAVTKEGGPAAQNINNLNNFLQKITTSEAQKAMNGLGVATKTATGEFRPTTDVLADLKVALGGMTESARANALQAIFPDAQARQGAMTLMSQLDLVRSATEENRTSSGAAAAAYAKMSETFNSQSKLLMNGLMAILTAVGALLLPVITPLITAFAQELPGAFNAAQEAIAPVAEQVMSFLVPAFEAVMAVLPTVIGLIQDLFDIFMAGDSFDVAAEALDQVFGTGTTDMILDFVALAGEAFRALAQFAVEHVTTIVSFYQENWPLIQQTVQTVLAAIATFWQQHGAAIVTNVQAAWTIITTLIKGSVDIILSLFKAGMQAINGDWAGAWETLVGLVGRTLERLLTILTAAFEGWYALFDSATGGLLTSIGTWLTDTAAAITNGWQTATDSTTTGWEAITTAISGAIDGITSTLQAGWDGFLELIQGALTAIQTAVQTVWNAIPEDIRADLALIGQALATKWQEFTTTVSSALTAIQSAVQTGWETISTTIATILGTIGQALATAWTTITGTVTTQTGVVQETVGTAWASVQSITQSTWSSIVTAVTGPISQVVEAVRGMGETITTTLRNLASNVGSTAQSIGSAIVNGIISGVRSMGDSLGSVLGNLVRGALQTAKNALDIRSPSKVFSLEVGKPIVQGIMAGLDSMTRPLDSALAGLVNAPRLSPTYAGASAGGSTGGMGGMQTIRVDVAIGGRVSEQIWIDGYKLLARSGGLPGRFGDAP